MRKINPARLLQKKSLARAGQGNKTQFFCDVLQPSRPLWTAVKGHAFSCRGEFTTKRSPCQGQKATFFVFCCDIFCILLKIILIRLYAAAFTR